ncbi:MAG: UDP-N-acetylmuramoyl-tripeptide--D-alanyl-D-alanine ligase [Treponema sp.]|nr:UDP-N-acetylmuramoyl-tripeptide--D-alanyl-D-alanine ligase [Treponema sp.]
MSLLTLTEVLEAVNGKIVCKGETDFAFFSVATDSRNVEKDCLFVPLVGEVQDGHIYIHQAIKNGAVAVFVAISWVESNGKEIATLSGSNVWIIGVENTLFALQAIAAKYVQKFPNLIKIGITGSSGKTTTKEIALSVFKEVGNVIANEGNLNSETGLPLSVFKIRAEHKFGIFEMGMNRAGEMAELANVLRPKYVLITNIGTAHIGILGSRDNIAIEKKSACNYFTDECVLFVNKNDDYAKFLAKGLKGKIKYYSPSMSCISDVQDRGLEGTRFFIDNNAVNFKLYGKYNFLNALGVVALAKELGISSEKIAQGLEKVKVLFGRAQIIRNFANIKGCTLILDCYNANPDSMAASLNFCSGVDIEGKKYFILGDMLELGNVSKKEHEKVGELVANASKNVSKGICNIFVGKEMKDAVKVIKKYLKNENKSIEIFYYEKADDNVIENIALFLKKNLKRSDMVLLKGSRGLALERIVNMLEAMLKTGEEL